MRTEVKSDILRVYETVTISSIQENDYKQLCDYIKTGTIKTVDVSDITEADSACVALLVAAKRLAYQQNISLDIKGVSSGLITLMALYGVEGSLQ